MKKSSDPRHLKRIEVMQILFSASFLNKKITSLPDDYNKMITHMNYIDKLIEASAPQFPLMKIAKIDVAILRLAIYELCLIKKEPPKVIIDEAIELAKEFGSDTSSSFVNGVLGTIYKDYYGQND